MNVNYSFISYAEIFTECREKGLVEGRDQELYLADKILNDALNSVVILDFIGAEHLIKGPKHHERILVQTADIFYNKYGKSIPIVLFNIDETRLEKLKLTKELLNWLKRNSHAIPVIDEYGELVSILGVNSHDQGILKCFLKSRVGNVVLKEQYEQLDDNKIIDSNAWLWEKIDTDSYRSLFSLKNVIEMAATNIIKEKIRATETGHFQLLSGKHATEYISASALYTNPHYTGWMARIIYSNFKRKHIDFIVFYSSQTLILALELKEEFEKGGINPVCLEMENYNKPLIKHSPPYYKKFKGKKILILVDVISTGGLIESMADSIAAEEGTIVGIASVVDVKNYNGRYKDLIYSPCKYYIDLKDSDCPECQRQNLFPLKYVSPITNSLANWSSPPEDYDAIFNGNEENGWFWEKVIETNALKTHILLEVGEEKKHYFSYIDTFAILHRYINEINWGLKCWYTEGSRPDIILAPNNRSALRIANHISKKEFPGTKLIRAKKKGDIYTCGDEKLLKNKKILIVDDGANTCRTLNGLLHICQRNTNNRENVKVCIFINRLIGDHRHMLEGQIPEKNIKSICRIPIPPFTDDQRNCPLCREIKKLKKHYSLMSPEGKEYIDSRLEKIELSEYSSSEFNQGRRTPESTILRIKALDFLYGKGSSAFLDALRHKTPLSKLWLVLETIPKEYISMSDIKEWLSDQIPETTNIRHLTKLVNMWLNVDPNIILKHIDHIVEQFAMAKQNKFLTFLLEFLICEHLTSREEVKNSLKRSLKKTKGSKSFLKGIINSAINKYPEEILFRPSLQTIYKDSILDAAKSNANILLVGETGTGKNVIAKIIHEISNRSTKPFKHITIGNLSPNLIESELFGHEKDAFTGSNARRPGKLEIADGGTVFLDEIGDIPLHLQAKLLNVIENKTLERVGGNEEIKTDFRLVCASNKPLEKLIREKKFREDLYYRIKTITVKLPTLRDNLSDIDSLAKYFFDIFSKAEGKSPLEYTNKMKKILRSHSWPGNIRELKHCIERIVILTHNGVIDFQSLKAVLNSAIEKEDSFGPGTYKEQVANFKKIIVIDALKKNKGQKTLTATSLSISRKRVYDLIADYNIKPEDYSSKTHNKKTNSK